ncbi:respiratory nitrate reductase subunit gamma [Alkalilimnicola ehrlichii]|uniref:respiratory nitrate reductase subunit gamma n=1 Tax=Alkalilimnicola ehrlichii TaxID=351052 RepID=UPI000E2F685B|nr:respiratory nitrate reductase subunit gamma [Alkalilimnicola ehrlichii]RFA28995.1 respiratory nitrate reductase subunit gamma [Alkalilimnicola ehrlichii]
MEYLHQLIFGVGPYLAGTIFILGSILRYERGQYTWRTMSSQMLHNTRTYRVGNLLFHIGILALFFGHLFGLLTPPAFFYAIGVTPAAKQVFAMVAGGIFGVICLAGLVILLWRRFTVPAVQANSAPMDNFILLLIFGQLLTGLFTIYVSRHHMDGLVMTELVAWARGIVSFQGGAWMHLVEVPSSYKLHIALGLVMFAAFPFSRLVHIWSWPWVYLRRNYQVVRSR